MIIIADSGSTKTDWAFVAPNGDIVQRLNTPGINPFHQDDAAIKGILCDVASSLESAGDGISIFFYGAGCTPEQASRVRNLLLEFFTSASSIEVYSDMFGAARAVCGRRMGVACILGTGANSCLYDGERIVANTPALGYVLGDEGSGAVLGRLFLNALYKGRLPQSLRETFERETSLTMADIIRRVYREPLANRFLASLSPFISRHLDVEPLRELVIENFRQFFRNNVEQYKVHQLLLPPVSFVGSMAFCYSNELREAARIEEFTIGQIVKSPMDGLITYHYVQP